MYSADYKWREVTLHYAYAVPCEVVGRVLGVSGRAVRRWYAQFKLIGHVLEKERCTLMLCVGQDFLLSGQPSLVDVLSGLA
ncbi:hypothetical protein PC120_g16809 [Phytophthora cactorum]|nr:hypothetical protein PC120_g16809 [Phytophthora cactorum]